MAGTAVFMAPMARKKTVSEKYSPNTFRVISQQAERFDRVPPSAVCLSPYMNVIGQVQVPRPSSEHRHNQPNPRNVGFLRQDVRLLNEPVCDVHTSSTQGEQHSWWPSRTSNAPLTIPPRTLDTTIRTDYQYRGKDVRFNTRHSANPNSNPALGSVPVNHLREPNGKQRFWKEGISYEHQFNSRKDPSYPIRAKRHGSFVWNRMADADVDCLKTRLNMDAESSVQTQQAAKQFDSIVSAEPKNHHPQSTIQTVIHPGTGFDDQMAKVD